MAVYMTVKPGMRDWLQDKVDETLISEKNRERDLAFLRGDGQLTVGQVQKLSRQIQIPFGFFFLDTPPQETLPILQYRTVDNEYVDHPSRNLIDTVSFARMIQNCVQETRHQQDYPPLSFVGSEQSNAKAFRVSDTANSVFNALGLKKDWNTRGKRPEDALKRLRDAAQDIGIIVVIDRLVRHNTRRHLNTDEFRAFCFSDALAPLIFINGNDAVAAQIFSLLHEIVHLFIGRDDFFNGSVDSASGSLIRHEEAFCNSVAGEILAPRSSFAALWAQSAGDLEDKLQQLSLTFKGTIPAMAYRALTYGLITEEVYERFIEKRREQSHTAHMLPLRDAGPSNASAGSGGPSPAVLALSRLGPYAVSAIADSVRDGRMSYMQAFHLTGTTLSTFKTLVENATGRRWAP